MEQYDLLVVGSGLFGSIVAYEAAKAGKKVLVVDKRSHIGGNCYTDAVGPINVHSYGAHIFRTDDADIWDYMKQFCEFNNFVNSPVANFHGELYNLPFNMNTFYQLWGTVTPEQAKKRIEETRVKCEDPTNLKEHILNLVGSDIFEKLVEGYTEKQWGKSCRELPPSIMRRIPLRFIYDNNYFNARYQGIPMGGYTAIFEKMLAECEVRLGVNYLDDRAELGAIAGKTVYTGAIDEFFGFEFGELEYRSLRFEHEELPVDNYQGVAVMNFTDAETPYTRIIEHKHFEFVQSDSTVISREYPYEWRKGVDPYYPMEDEGNRSKYAKYLNRAQQERDVLFGGRLGEYRYYDMQDTVKSALAKYKEWFGGR